MWQKIFQLLRKKWKQKLQLNLKMVSLPSKLKCKRTKPFLGVLFNQTLKATRTCKSVWRGSKS